MSSRAIPILSDCMAERTVFWIRQRFIGYPAKAVAQKIEEAPATVDSWFRAQARPSVDAICRLFRKFPAMIPFVVEPYLAPNWQRQLEKLREAKKLLEDLEGLRP